MPAGASQTLRMTATEYLAWEREQKERHDFFRGEVFSMAGGKPRHNALVAAMTIELGARLRGGPCRVLSTEQRIVARGGEHCFYADASVVCGKMELAAGANDVLVNPAVVIEVLSKSTQSYDRGEKWESYQGIASLTDYLLVSQHAPRVEHYRREPNGEWHYRVVETGGRVTLTNGATIDVDAVYAGVFELESD